MKRFATFLFAFAAAALCAQTGAQQAARQARSVHLIYQNWGEPAEIFYIEGTVQEFWPGSYMCMIGFSGGYAGVQEHYDGRHLAIFSVWEPGDHNDLRAKADAVEEEKRTKELYCGEGVQIRRFGGEGTGGQSMMDFAWRPGEKVCMAVSCAREGDLRTAYTCWVWKGEEAGWFRMATFSTLEGGDKATLRGPNSFLEDFRRNVESKKHVRSAHFSRLWAYAGGEWRASDSAVFSGDSNLLKTIDAGPAPSGFWLATGGKTQNATTPLWTVVRPGGAPDGSEARRKRLLEAVRAMRSGD